MNSITIRKATPADLESILKLNQELCQKEHDEYDETINQDYPFTGNGKKYFTFRIESADSQAFVAESGKDAIGYLVGGIIKAEDYRTVKKLAEVENMYIKAAFRGNGIGARLLEQFEMWCREQNVERIRFVASAENEKAISFYKTNGAEAVAVTLEKKL